MEQIVSNVEPVTFNLQSALSGRILSVKQASLFVKIGLIAFGSLIVAIAQLVQIPAGGALTGWQWAGIISSFIVAIGSGFAIYTEHDSTEQLFLAANAIEQVTKDRLNLEQQLNVLDEFYDEFSQVVEVYQATLLMRDALEAFSANGFDDEQLCHLMIRASQRSLRIAMNFRTEDQATICIYKADLKDGGTKLRCVAHWREVECEVSSARQWDEGVGIAGVCFANAREIIVPDLQADGVRAVFGGDSSRSKPYDSDRYRSMVAVPIMVQNVGIKPWGVVVATNNRVGHFAAESTDGVTTDEGARALANMVALGISMCRMRMQSPNKS